MRESDAAIILERCIAEMERGGGPDSVSARYPTASLHLTPILELAARLRASRDEYTPPKDFLRALGEQLGRPSA